VNHNGEIELAKKLIDVAAAAGADAVKFQTFNAFRLVTPDAPKAAYQHRTTSEQESQLDMLRQLELSAEDHRVLIEYCRACGVLFLSTPFDEQSADLLYDLDVPAFKIPSGEVTNLPLLAHVARFGRPMIVSTGMCDLGEVEAAVETIRDEGNDSIVLLHCVSNYPANPADVNLRAMQTMQAAFRVPVGYSDHTLGVEVGLAAVATGACLLEKHFTLDCGLSGPDHEASLNPTELAMLIRGIRIVEAALGDGQKRAAASEANTAATIRKSLVAARDIPAGGLLTEEVIVSKRPGTGLPPATKPHLLGRIAKEDISAGELLELGKVA